MSFLMAAKGLRQAIAFVAAFVASAIVFCSIVLNNVNAEEATKPPVETVSSKEALARLEQGNRRCVEGKSAHGHDQERWRERLLVKQKPLAAVLGCSDSRVPPELLFDQGFGELFVIRVAGNIVDPDVVGSIQYAVKHVDNKLIVVLGHQNCGAVTAALSPPNQKEKEPPAGTRQAAGSHSAGDCAGRSEPGAGTTRRGGGRGQCACIGPAAPPGFLNRYGDQGEERSSRGSGVPHRFRKDHVSRRMTLMYRKRKDQQHVKDQGETRRIQLSGPGGTGRAPCGNVQ